MGISNSLGCRYHEMVECEILGGERKESSRRQTLDFRRADFGTFRKLVGQTPGEASLKGKGAEVSQQALKVSMVQVQEQSGTHEDKQTYQETALGHQRAHGGAPMQEDIIQKVEAGMCYERGI